MPYKKFLRNSNTPNLNVCSSDLEKYYAKIIFPLTFVQMPV